ncbi:hypothetical protein Trydic_g12679 [Trypoxylus dichotomus]
MHRGGIPRRRQSLRQGLAPEPTTEDAPSRHLQGNGQARSVFSPQEDLPSQAGRTTVHHEDVRANSIQMEKLRENIPGTSPPPPPPIRSTKIEENAYVVLYPLIWLHRLTSEALCKYTFIRKKS